MQTEHNGFLMQSKDGALNIPLCGVDVSVELAGLLAHTTISQQFLNSCESVIEAIYAFPLPLGATLLGLTIEIDGQKLSGMVYPKKNAERQYEEAVGEGNGAFLLRELVAGRYQMVLGNLKPGERCRVEIRYAEFLQKTGTTTRFRLPTVIAPHYGDPGHSGISPEDVSPVSLVTEYPFSAVIRLSGALARGQISCPTHRVETRHEGEMATVSLKPGAFIDRDLVLLIIGDSDPVAEAWSAPDGDALAVMALVTPPAMSVGKRVRRDLTVLIDCSGSMAGNAIGQVRSALRAILEKLEDGDTLSILRFGSTVASYAKEPIEINLSERSRLGRWVMEIDADLGGTEILAGIRAAIQQSVKGADILLITDGEAEVSDKDLQQVTSSGHRFFTVGVGAAVSERIVRTLAEKSGGACELVTPNETMSESIVNQFLRMHGAPANVSIAWGDQVSLNMPPRGGVFRGETSIFMARLSDGRNKEAVGQVSIAVSTGDQGSMDVVKVYPASGALQEALPRMLAYRELQGLENEAAVELAVRYQLLTGETSMVAVLERNVGEQTDGFPTVVNVPQMLAAGWGGLGDVSMHCSESYAPYDSPTFMRPNPLSRSASLSRRLDNGINMYDIPAFLRRDQSDGASIRKMAPLRFVLHMQSEIGDINRFERMTWSEFRALFEAMIPEGLLSDVEKLAAIEQIDLESPVLVIAFLESILDSLDAQGKRKVRLLRRLLADARSVVAIPDSLVTELARLFVTVMNARWGIYEALPPSKKQGLFSFLKSAIKSN